MRLFHNKEAIAIFDKLKTETINLFLLIGIALLVLEFTFHDGGYVFFLVITIGCIYFGRKKMPRSKGKFLFWFGMIFFTLTLLNTLAFKFLILAMLGYAIFQYVQSQKKPQMIKPESAIRLDKDPVEGIVMEKPLLSNILFGRQQTPKDIYEWQDINIQTGIGDTVIDLSNTVLPKEEAVIFIRGFIGNVQIYIPYELEVSLKHSVMAGAVNVLDYKESRKMNKTIFLETEAYKDAKEKLKICTSLLVGDIEVRRK
ncbi:cell wall-active antibiotics response protein LiaF [Metabacillus flavus]|uniref:cell wall-active antibiotics response protein LiaF n=1 Tax=Metabacillus flavus TaxID=2823519 RepID=UPI0020164988|nr:cell wall-active antibiotics response protein LiaF [Metabacillus flavus]